MEVKFNARELQVVGELCEQTGLTQSALMRQALRIYQSQHIALQGGRKTFTEGPEELKCGCTFDIQHHRVLTTQCIMHEQGAGALPSSC